MTNSIDNTTKTIAINIAKFEKLGAQRAAIVAGIGDNLKALDAERKEARQAMTTTFKTLQTADAVVLANMLAPATQGADDALRKILSRRRATLRQCLTAAFPAYDFEVEKGRFSKGIVYSYVGNAEQRRANELLSVVSMLANMGYTMPEIDRDELAGMLASNSADTAPINIVDPLQAILAGNNTASLLAELEEEVTGTASTKKKSKAA